MSSLMFGFAVNFFTRFASEAHEYNEHYVLQLVLCGSMALVLVCNAFTMIVLSLTNYHVRRYLAAHGWYPDRIQLAKDYLDTFRKYRSAARWTFYLGLILFMIAIITYMQPHFTRTIQIVVTVVLGGGTIVIGMTTYMMLNPNDQVWISDAWDRNSITHRSRAPPLFPHATHVSSRDVFFPHRPSAMFPDATKAIKE